MFEELLDLGDQPVSNRFLCQENKEKVPRYSLRLLIEKDTGRIILENPFPVKELKPRFEWLTCFEPEDHLEAMVRVILELPGVGKQSVFAGYSFKDDSTLVKLKNQGYQRQWRIDPHKDLGLSDPCASIETFQSVFNSKKSGQIQKKQGYADVLIIRHVVEHAYDLPGFISAVTKLIHDEGYIVWELPDCEGALERGDCTIIWEEHTNYFTRFTFHQVLEDAGLISIFTESVSYPLENSLIIITKKNNDNISRSPVNTAAVNKEKARARKFAKIVKRRRKVIQSKLQNHRVNRGPVVMFGAGHLSVAFISIMELEEGLIDFVIDDNPHKKGLMMPIGEIKILDSDSLYTENVSLCLLGLNPQNHPKLMAKHTRFIKKGGMFASIFPGTNFYLDQIA